MIKWPLLVAVAAILVLLSGSQVCADLNDGLVAHYPFNGNAEDESGNGNDGVVDGAILAADRDGNADSAYYFDGEDDFINIGKDASLDIDNSSFSIAMWINVPHTTDGSLISKGASNTKDQFLTIFWKDNGVVRFGFYDDGLSVGTGISVNHWHHLVFIFDSVSKERRIFVNGEFKGSDTADGSLTNTVDSDFILGSNQVTTEKWFEGYMDDVRIYSRALYRHEIGLLAEPPPHTTDSPAGPDDAGSAMYTLEDIYNRLNTGAEGTKGTGFTEPSAGPDAITMNNLNEIMLLAPAEDNMYGAAPDDVVQGKVFWDLRTDGTWGPTVGTLALPNEGQIRCGATVLGVSGKCEFAVGDKGPGGGLVFELTDGGAHGKEITFSSIGNYSQENAVTACEEYNNGFTDWYLPSIEELKAACREMTVQDGSHVWTSDTYNRDGHLIGLSIQCHAGCLIQEAERGNRLQVRPVRQW